MQPFKNSNNIPRTLKEYSKILMETLKSSNIQSSSNQNTIGHMIILVLNL